MVTESKLSVRVYSSGAELGNYPAWEARIPAFKGEMGVRPYHSPFVGALSVGVVFIQAEQQSRFGDDHWFFVSGGFFEVTDSALILLVNTWEEASSIDFARAEQARERAVERLKLIGSQVDIPRALAALKRAEARLSLRTVLRPGSFVKPFASGAANSTEVEEERSAVNA